MSHRNEWRFVVTDLGFVPQGEINNAYDKQVVLPLNKLDSCSFRVRLDNPVADRLLSTEGYIKAYRNEVLRFFGPIISSEESVESANQSVAVNAMGAGWIFGKRFVGKSAAGSPPPVVGGVPQAADRAVRFSGFLDTCNAENETGIEVLVAASASTVLYTGGPYKTLGTTLGELSAGDSGFDWRILPKENFTNFQVIGNKIGTMIMQPILGSTRDSVVFEYGTGKNNVVGYKRAVSRDGQANKVYHNAQAGPDAPGYPTKFASDAGSINSWKLMEDLAEADLYDASLRQQLVDAHVAVRKNPRQTINFEPVNSLHERVPRFGIDFDIGDNVEARAVYRGSIRFDVLARVWAATFDIDNDGAEKMTLTLSDDGST